MTALPSQNDSTLAITDEVSRISDVESVEVDLDTKVVRVRGAGVDAGYEAVAA